ncbi:hypothetical protein OKC48_07495 [Methylorubrum extorquens]|uniref:hypothetical protein n=1 Tax=Methylorubrum extorquens TaxID=408 RepID=UPI002237F29C|nr:hypothetical protein [Methylorubrum extorquens]UYW28350.1 hypothetical protein OKC48_07495 [Methylorubrum extorquens]
MAYRTRAESVALRDAVLDRFAAGEGLAGIASALGISMSAVGYALQRGRALRDPRAAFRYAAAASGRADRRAEALPGMAVDAWPTGLACPEIGRLLGVTIPGTSP